MTTIADDTDCTRCDALAVETTCERCGVSAKITDCGHLAQPRPIASGDADGFCAHRTFCAACAVIAAEERRADGDARRAAAAR